MWSLFRAEPGRSPVLHFLFLYLLLRIILSLLCWHALCVCSQDSRHSAVVGFATVGLPVGSSCFLPAAQGASRVVLHLHHLCWIPCLPSLVFWFTSLCVVYSTGASGESSSGWYFINVKFKASSCFLGLPWNLTGHGALVGNNFSVGFSFAPVTFSFLVLPLVSLKSLCFCPALLSENLCDGPDRLYRW